MISQHLVIHRLVLIRRQTCLCKYVLYLPRYSKNFTVLTVSTVNEISVLPIPWNVKQEAEIMLANLHDAFRGQSRPPNMVPFNMLGVVSY